MGCLAIPERVWHSIVQYRYRQGNARAVNSRRLDEKIRRLDEQLVRHREAINKARPGPAQEAAKRRALTVLKQKKQYEAQRDQLYNQQFSIEQTSFVMQGMQDTVSNLAAMETAAAELKKIQKTNKQLNPDKIWNLMDQMQDMQADFEEIQEAMGSFGTPVDLDEDELLGELEALGDELMEEGIDQGENGVPSYLQEVELPEAPTGVTEGSSAVPATSEPTEHSSMALPAGYSQR